MYTPRKNEEKKIDLIFYLNDSTLSEAIDSSLIVWVLSGQPGSAEC